jgi:hypothetical protein
MSTSCSSAFGEDRETWRCDVPNGTYSMNDTALGGITKSISGRINFHKSDFGQTWSSTAKIGFTDSKIKQSGCHCNGILVMGFPNTVGFYMLVDGDIVLLSGRPYDTPITFKLSVNPQGIMTVKLGKQYLDTKTAALPHPVRDTLTMTCSGADVSFLNIQQQ